MAGQKLGDKPLAKVEPKKPMQPLIAHAPTKPISAHTSYVHAPVIASSDDERKRREKRERAREMTRVQRINYVQRTTVVYTPRHEYQSSTGSSLFTFQNGLNTLMLYEIFKPHEAVAQAQPIQPYNMQPAAPTPV